jgi:hypothetical protein
MTSANTLSYADDFIDIASGKRAFDELCGG